MSEPAFYTDNHEPRRTATKLEVLNKILGAILDLGVVDTTNPIFYTDGCVPRREATEIEVLQKILGALIGLGGGPGPGPFCSTPGGGPIDPEGVVVGCAGKFWTNTANNTVWKFLGVDGQATGWELDIVVNEVTGLSDATLQLSGGGSNSADLALTGGPTSDSGYARIDAHGGDNALIVCQRAAATQGQSAIAFQDVNGLERGAMGFGNIRGTDHWNRALYGEIGQLFPATRGLETKFIVALTHEDPAWPGSQQYDPFEVSGVGNIFLRKIDASVSFSFEGATGNFAFGTGGTPLDRFQFHATTNENLIVRPANLRGASVSVAALADDGSTKIPLELQGSEVAITSGNLGIGLGDTTPPLGKVHVREAADFNLRTASAQARGNSFDLISQNDVASGSTQIPLGLIGNGIFIPSSLNIAWGDNDAQGKLNVSQGTGLKLFSGTGVGRGSTFSLRSTADNYSTDAKLELRASELAVTGGNVGINIGDNAPLGQLQIRQATNLNLYTASGVGRGGAFSLVSTNDANNALAKFELRGSELAFTGMSGVGINVGDNVPLGMLDVKPAASKHLHTTASTSRSTAIAWQAANDAGTAIPMELRGSQVFCPSNLGIGLGDNDTAEALDVSGNVQLRTAGNGVKIKEGSNATMGVATLVGGAATVSTTKVTANSRIFLTSQVDGGTPGSLRVDTRTAGTSFHIQSSSGTDTSTIGWLIIEPA